MKAISIFSIATFVAFLFAFTSATPIHVPERELTKRTTACEGTICDLPAKRSINCPGDACDLPMKPDKRNNDDGAGQNLGFKPEKRIVVCEGQACDLTNKPEKRSVVCPGTACDLPTKPEKRMPGQ